MEDREPIILENHGQKIFAMYHRPVGIEKAPAVLMCHGFGGNKCGKFRIYVLVAEALAKQGIATLRFDFRGFGESEGDTSEVTIEREVSDATVAMNHLLSIPQVDTDRIGIFGTSLGGLISILTACKFPLVKSLALWAPVFHGKQWLEKWKQLQTSPEQLQNTDLMNFNGNIVNEEFLKQFFNIKLENELSHLATIPLLHIHGEKDSEVLPSHADYYAAARKSATGKTKMIRLPHTDHEFSQCSERAFAIEETSTWFKETL